MPPELKQLTLDRRPLYEITDHETREFRYREMFYEANRRAEAASQANTRLMVLLRDVLDEKKEAIKEATQLLLDAGLIEEKPLSWLGEKGPLAGNDI